MKGGRLHALERAPSLAVHGFEIVYESRPDAHCKIFRRCAFGPHCVRPEASSQLLACATPYCSACFHARAKPKRSARFCARARRHAPVIGVDPRGAGRNDGTSPREDHPSPARGRIWWPVAVEVSHHTEGPNRAGAVCPGLPPAVGARARASTRERCSTTLEVQNGRWGRGIGGDQARWIDHGRQRVQTVHQLRRRATFVSLATHSGGPCPRLRSRSSRSSRRPRWRSM